MPYAEFLKTRFYREWKKPQGLVDCINVALDKCATSITLLGVSRHARDGMADEAVRRRMRLLVPHLRRAILIARAMERKTAEASMFADLLGGLRAGAMLVDANGYIVHANLAAEVMLDAGDLIRRGADGRLSAWQRKANHILHGVLATTGGGDGEMGRKGTAVPLVARNGEHYVAHVLPLRSGARSGVGKSYAAVAALFVRKVSLRRPSPPEVIAETYQLTPMELRVLLAVVEIGGAPDVADALGVSTETVKTHLARLFAKTGSRRQADLVRLVAGFATPLLN
jgi:DNA-binding CsgD family transcriptional regulator